MKLSRIILISLLFFIPQTICAQKNLSAERAWKPFFVAFRAAAKKRNREALRKMMVSDFYFSGGGGDDNGDGDTREEAFQFFSEPHTHGWKALDRALAQGSVPMATWWDHGAKRKYVSRISPPAANIKNNIDRTRVAWLATFEFREGRWYCTSFSECCD